MKRKFQKSWLMWLRKAGGWSEEATRMGWWAQVSALAKVDVRMRA